MSTMTTSMKTAIVCGTCTAINYRSAELTCKKCGDYFPTKRTAAPLAKSAKIDGNTVTTIVAGCIIAGVSGSAVLALTLLLGSLM